MRFPVIAPPGIGLSRASWSWALADWPVCVPLTQAAHEEQEAERASPEDKSATNLQALS